MRSVSRPHPYICSFVAAAALMAACGSSEAPAPTPAKLAGIDIALAADTVVVRNVVPRNTTLDALLREHGVEAEMVGRIVASMAGVFDPRQLRSLQPFVIERSTLGSLRLFEYEIDADRFLRVSAADDAPAISAEVLPIPKTKVESTAAGVIDKESSSLFAAMKTAGERDDLAIALAQIFSGEIDFNTEIRLEDRFAVVFERYQRDGRPDTYGDVLAAEIHNDGRVIKAIRFTLPDGTNAFYDERGRSLRRFFLKSPLKFEPRVTSGFSLSRRHPVLHTSRAHRGVDYAAPTGAPVVSVAAGTVVGATYDNANGRMVRVRHPSGYESYYLHLSRFAAGMRAGARVQQGDVVGYVGSTGLSTGPHLHYGLKKNGSFVNPIAEHRNMPPGEPVPASSMKAFIEVRDRALAGLAEATASQGSGQAQGGSPPAVAAAE
jgi:murein DD-endopeptidase MepM/ murein hydrolase activator NlpD